MLDEKDRHGFQGVARVMAAVAPRRYKLDPLLSTPDHHSLVLITASQGFTRPQRGYGRFFEVQGVNSDARRTRELTNAISCSRGSCC